MTVRRIKVKVTFTMVSGESHTFIGSLEEMKQFQGELGKWWKRWHRWIQIAQTGGPSVNLRRPHIESIVFKELP